MWGTTEIKTSLFKTTKGSLIDLKKFVTTIIIEVLVAFNQSL